MHSSRTRVRPAATGAYRLDGLAPGEYKLHFYDCNFPETRDHYAPEDWPTLVTVGTGEVGPVSPELARGGVITGTVKAQDMPDGLPSVCVRAVGNNGFAVAFDTFSFTRSYRLTGLPGGKYAVEFKDCTFGLYAPEDATVTVQVRSVKTKNAVLRVGGIIEGLVTSEETGAPLSDIKVDVYDKTGGLAFPVWTNQSGSYRVTGLPSGSYDLHFATDDDAVVASEWWDDQLVRADADPVKVTMGKTKLGVNAALSAGGAINGTVRDASTGEPVAACITATSASREFRRLWVAPSGSYRLGGIVGDDVVVRFSACGSPSVMLATKWHDDAINAAAATPIAVDNGDELTGIDAGLEPFGTYAGQAVVAGSGFPRVPAQNVCASLYAPDGSLVDTTEQRGFSFPVFRFAFLNPRVYTLVVDDCGDADLYAPVTLPATPTPGNGAPIVTIEMPPAPTTCHGQVPTIVGTSRARQAARNQRPRRHRGLRRRRRRHLGPGR